MHVCRCMYVCMYVDTQKGKGERGNKIDNSTIYMVIWKNGKAKVFLHWRRIYLYIIIISPSPKMNKHTMEVVMGTFPHKMLNTQRKIP